MYKQDIMLSSQTSASSFLELVCTSRISFCNKAKCLSYISIRGDIHVDIVEL